MTGRSSGGGHWTWNREKRPLASLMIESSARTTVCKVRSGHHVTPIDCLLILRPVVNTPHQSQPTNVVHGSMLVPQTLDVQNDNHRHVLHPHRERLTPAPIHITTPPDCTKAPGSKPTGPLCGCRHMSWSHGLVDPAAVS